jgi:hypothetical protein
MPLTIDGIWSSLPNNVNTVSGFMRNAAPGLVAVPRPGLADRRRRGQPLMAAIRAARIERLGVLPKASRTPTDHQRPVFSWTGSGRSDCDVGSGLDEYPVGAILINPCSSISLICTWRRRRFSCSSTGRRPTRTPGVRDSLRGLHRRGREHDQRHRGRLRKAADSVQDSNPQQYTDMVTLTSQNARHLGWENPGGGGQRASHFSTESVLL